MSDSDKYITGATPEGEGHSKDGAVGDGTKDGVNPRQEVPSFIKFMPSLVQELYDEGVALRLDPKDFNLLVEGFYSNGPLKLLVKEGDSGSQKIFSVDKNNVETLIDSYKTLAELNYNWWVASQTKRKYVAPLKPWLDFFKKENLVKRSVMYLPKQNRGGDKS